MGHVEGGTSVGRLHAVCTCEVCGVVLLTATCTAELDGEGEFVAQVEVDIETRLGGGGLRGGDMLRMGRRGCSLGGKRCWGGGAEE